jgi:hypothetical protein
MWRAYSEVIHCVFDQIQNLQNCFTTPNKNLGGEWPQIDKHLPPSTLLVNFLKSRHLGFGVFIDIWSMLSALYSHITIEKSHRIHRKQATS